MPATCSARLKDAEADIKDAIALNKNGGDGAIILQKTKSAIQIIGNIESCSFGERGPSCSEMCQKQTRALTLLICGKGDS